MVGTGTIMFAFVRFRHLVDGWILCYCMTFQSPVDTMQLLSQQICNKIPNLQKKLKLILVQIVIYVENRNITLLCTHPQKSSSKASNSWIPFPNAQL